MGIRAVRSGYVVRVPLGSLTGAAHDPGIRRVGTRRRERTGLSGRFSVSRRDAVHPGRVWRARTLRVPRRRPRGRGRKRRFAASSTAGPGPASTIRTTCPCRDGQPTHRRREPISVILFADDRPVASVHPTLPRPDVAQLLKNERLRQSGYTFRIRMETCASDTPAAGFRRVGPRRGERTDERTGRDAWTGRLAGHALIHEQPVGSSHHDG